MKRVMENAITISCEEDTEEASIMKKIVELSKEQRRIEERRKTLRERLIQLAHEDGEENPVLIAGGLMAAWYTNERPLTTKEWRILREEFPEAFIRLDGGHREGSPFFAVTQIRK